MFKSGTKAFKESKAMCPFCDSCNIEWKGSNLIYCLQCKVYTGPKEEVWKWCSVCRELYTGSDVCENCYNPSMRYKDELRGIL